MLEIEYKGANSLVFSGKKSTIYVDPKLSVVGLKDLKVAGETELATEERFAIRDENAKLTIDQPGEYEIGDFSVKGIAALRHIDQDYAEKASTIYRVECGDISVGLLGNIAASLSDDQLEKLGVVDILILPVGGGGYTLDATSATALVRSISPKAVIPVHYNDPSINYEVPQDSVDVFIKELGAPVENIQKLKLKNDAALPDALIVYILAR